MIFTSKIKIENGAVGDQPILKAWETFSGDYFLALDRSSENEYYGLFRNSRNEAEYVTLKENQISQMKMMPIKNQDLSSFSFEVDDPMEVIFSYTAEQAEEDGILVRLHDYTGPNGQPVYITNGLYTDGGYEDYEQIKQLVENGFDLLKLPDEEDKYSSRKLRVIEKDKIWVIEDGATVTFLKPDEY